MLAIMVLLGGLTRLTHSGLSMVEWEPLVGVIPPLSLADWQILFSKYQKTPEYLQVNQGMTLDDFKDIFWLEYLHRLWGRMIGLAFALPFLWMTLRKKINRRLWPGLAGLLFVGGLQGLAGWYMVRSGLVKDPTVSHYRLALHLALAFLLHGWMLWLGLSLLGGAAPSPLLHRSRPLRFGLLGLVLMVSCTVLFGALVAGLHAGLIYNSFPLMEGHLIPDDLWRLGWLSPFEDIKTVQFTHRCLAVLTVTLALTLWLILRRHTPGGKVALPMTLCALMALLQAGLGIATLLMMVPVWLASLHQMGALLLFTFSLWSLQYFSRKN